ncbi:MAG: hypothetical protein GY817_03740 [bacterium]|nr:hypothetical protein [bacterium]
MQVLFYFHIAIYTIKYLKMRNNNIYLVYLIFFLLLKCGDTDIENPDNNNINSNKENKSDLVNTDKISDDSQNDLSSNSKIFKNNNSDEP